MNNYYKDGKCSRCGNCCGIIIPFTEKELQIIKDYVKEHDIKQSNRISVDGQHMSCCFFDRENHKCSIYEVRPFVCKDFKCCRKDWMKRRDQYNNRAKYNSITPGKKKKVILATFDDLIYDDPYYICTYVALEIIGCLKGMGIDYKTMDESKLNKFLEMYLSTVSRIDLLPPISLIFKDNLLDNINEIFE